MIETVDTADEAILHVIDGIEFKGHINTPDDQLLANVQHSIRLGHPQVCVQPPKTDRVVLVGGGPSLDETLPELRDLYFAGAKVATVNGSYRWCIERNIRPSAQIVLDARAENARFVDPPVPGCAYLLASQCAPETWAAVQDRPNVRIWHAVNEGNTAVAPVLQQFYKGRWTATPGGTTVIMRAITVLRQLGYMRFDLFGVDSCFMDGKGHAYAQPENDSDKAHPFKVYPSGHPELAREFLCAPWHAKQIECFLQLIRLHGEQFLLNVHGDGVLAHVLKVCAQAEVECHYEA